MILWRVNYTVKLLVSVACWQPLLDVDHTSARLNLLTPRYVNQKGVALPTSSAVTRRAKRENLQQKQILVPELCDVHPFPASLWRKAVCLPAMLYRTNCLLIAEELRCCICMEAHIGCAADGKPNEFDSCPPLRFGSCDISQTGTKQEEESAPCLSDHQSADSSRVNCESGPVLQTVTDKSVDADSAGVVLTSRGNCDKCVNCCGCSLLAEDSCDCPRSTICHNTDVVSCAGLTTCSESDNRCTEKSDAVSEMVNGVVNYACRNCACSTLCKCSAADTVALDIGKSSAVVDREAYHEAEMCSFSLDADTSLSGGPTPCDIIQALTMSNANDFFNLERLETIGDSFLKFAISIYLYRMYPGIHEGKLSYLRSIQVQYCLLLVKKFNAVTEIMLYECHDMRK